MGKVKVSQLFKVIICAVTLYTLGFDKIITLPGSSFVYEILIAAIGVLLALYCAVTVVLNFAFDKELFLNVCKKAVRRRKG